MSFRAVRLKPHSKWNTAKKTWIKNSGWNVLNADRRARCVDRGRVRGVGSAIQPRNLSSLPKNWQMFPNPFIQFAAARKWASILCFARERREKEQRQRGKRGERGREKGENREYWSVFNPLRVLSSWKPLIFASRSTGSQELRVLCLLRATLASQQWHQPLLLPSLLTAYEIRLRRRSRSIPAARILDPGSSSCTCPTEDTRSPWMK